MAIDLELAPKQKRPAGEPCCEPVVYPDVEREHATRMAEVAKALGDPVRLQLVDVLRKHAGKVCVCGWCRFSTSRNRPSPTTSRSCGRPGSSTRSDAACGPTTTSTQKHWRNCPHG